MICRVEVEVDANDMEYLRKNLTRAPSFMDSRTETTDFYPDTRKREDLQVCYRLEHLGIIEQRPYYGEAMTYNPEYELTKLGRKVYEQFKSQVHGTVGN